MFKYKIIILFLAQIIEPFVIFRFKDYGDALIHTLNAHCDGANQTYPCPFCQRIVTSEHELSEHIDSHTNQKEVSCINDDWQCVYVQIDCRYSMMWQVQALTYMFCTNGHERKNGHPLFSERQPSSPTLYDSYFFFRVPRINKLKSDKQLNICFYTSIFTNPQLVTNPLNQYLMVTNLGWPCEAIDDIFLIPVVKFQLDWHPS